MNLQSKVTEKSVGRRHFVVNTRLCNISSYSLSHWKSSFWYCTIWMSPYKNTIIGLDWDPPALPLHSWACLHPGKKDIEAQVTCSPGWSDTGDWFSAFSQGLFCWTLLIEIIVIDQFNKDLTNLYYKLYYHLIIRYKNYNCFLNSKFKSLIV